MKTITIYLRPNNKWDHIRYTESESIYSSLETQIKDNCIYLSGIMKQAGGARITLEIIPMSEILRVETTIQK